MEHYLAIIEDDVSYRESMFDYLNAQPEFSCVLVAGSIEEFLADLAGSPHPPTLVLCDIGLPAAFSLRPATGLSPTFSEHHTQPPGCWSTH